MPNKSNSVVEQIVAFAKRSCCVSECVRACVRACVSEIPKTFESLLHLPPPAPPRSPSFCSSSSSGSSAVAAATFALTLPCLLLVFPLFHSRTLSPEAKEARVPLRLTFSGMNYFARQVDGRLRKNTTARFVESVTCCLRSPKWRNPTARRLLVILSWSWTIMAICFFIDIRYTFFDFSLLWVTECRRAAQQVD